MTRVAANKLVQDHSHILNNMYVERKKNKEIVRIASITEGNHEAAHTAFYNGLITTFVEKDKRKVGCCVLDLVEQPLEIGYTGKLLLWQKLSLSELQITVETVVKEL